jgi:two-component system KDP operon response regulator KdpE
MTVGMHLALVVEDDRAGQKILRTMLKGNGFRVLVANTCQRAVVAAHAHRPDVMLVDLGLPGQDGMHFIHQSRSWSPAPILVLSAPTAEARRVAVFDAGADDYILKPFSAPELLARVRAALRRHVRGGLPKGVLRFDQVTIDLPRRVVHQGDGRRVRLTPVEHRILELMARYPDRVVTHAQFMQEVWGPNCVDTRSLRVFIKNLRKKLEVDPSRPARIITEPRVGYRLLLESSRSSEAQPGEHQSKTQ